MRLVLALWLSSSAILAAAPRLAGADCASPRIAVGPGPGSTLPPDPTLHVFVPTPHGITSPVEFEVIAGGQRLPVEVEVASRTPALTVLRIDVRTGDHRSITLQPRTGPTWWKADFAVAAGRRRVIRPALRLRSARHERDDWTCSFTDAWLLSPATEADAYRVEWADTRSAWERGAQASAVFPRSERDLWSQPGEQGAESPHPPSIALGHVSCFAYTIPERAVRGPLYVKVTGLHADGSETAAWKEPRRLDVDGEGPTPPASPSITPPAALEASAPPPAALAPAAPATPAVAVSARWWPTVAVLIGLAGLALAVLRRRAPGLAPPPR